MDPMRRLGLVLVLALGAATCGADSSAESGADALASAVEQLEQSRTAEPTALPAPSADDGADAPAAEADTGDAGDAGDADEPVPESPPAAPPVVDGEVALLTVEVLGQRPHDARAFTQGLVLEGDSFYESTGQDSSLRRVDATTGEIEQFVALAPEDFGEGLELVDDRLIQLTWRSEVAYIYDAETFAVVDQFGYGGEGWGLCLDRDRLIMSDGSAELTHRDPTTFEVLDTVAVEIQGEPVAQLNELECVDGEVWANVWKTNAIVRIDPDSGAVTGVVDASLLAELATGDVAIDVLNGIAYDPVADTFLVTGKYWPTMFEVRFVPR